MYLCNMYGILFFGFVLNEELCELMHNILPLPL